MPNEEIRHVRSSLQHKRKDLYSEIEKSSVTLYTTRAKRQNMGIVRQMEKVDRASTAFEKERVYIKDQ